MKLPFDPLRFRRWFVSAMATRRPITLRTKLILGVLIFTLSYVTKSLQAVDLAHVMYTIEQPFHGLTVTYDQRAVSILEGEGLLGPYNIEPSLTVWLGQAPGYSIFLSGVYRVLGRDFFKVQLVQNAVNSLSPVLIFLIAGTVISWRVGFLSGLLAALSHHLSHISNFILPDSLCALPLLAAIYILLMARRRHHHRAYWLYAMAGVMIGISVWLRPQAMLAGLFLILMLAIISVPRLRAIKHAAVMAVASILVIAPITIRNYIVYGEFVPISIGVGLNLWEGIGEASGDRFGAVAKDQEVAAQDAIIYNDPRYAGTWSSPDGIMRDRDRTRKSLAIIVSHPVWYAGVILERMCEMTKYSAHAPLVFKISQVKPREQTAPVRKEWRSLVTDGSSLAVGESIFWMRPPLRALQRIAKETILPFILIGAGIILVASWRRGFFLLMVPLYYLLFQSFMHTEFRYTLPMHYFLFVFAATTWVLLGTAVWRGVKALSGFPLKAFEAGAARRS